MGVLKVNTGTSGTPVWTGIVALPQYVPRVLSQASTATLTIDASAYDMAVITAQAAGLTIAAPTGSPQEGQQVLIRIKDNGTARALTWNAAWRVVGVVLPTTTTLGKTHYIAARYNAADSVMDVLAVGVTA